MSQLFKIVSGGTGGTTKVYYGQEDISSHIQEVHVSILPSSPVVVTLKIVAPLLDIDAIEDAVIVKLEAGDEDMESLTNLIKDHIIDKLAKKDKDDSN